MPLHPFNPQQCLSCRTISTSEHAYCGEVKETKYATVWVTPYGNSPHCNSTTPLQWTRNMTCASKLKSNLLIRSIFYWENITKIETRVKLVLGLLDIQCQRSVPNRGVRYMYEQIFNTKADLRQKVQWIHSPTVNDCIFNHNLNPS